ncbi:MAG: enoyl-CoA hydratase/isomerase family protein [Actinobacteria bacterium]|nr:enoyl-CoA hydratase/isomerase family protein [Actinomycetota bacterium]
MNEVEGLVVTRDGGVVTIRMDRPGKHNAISYAMWQGFGRLMPELAEDDDVDVVVLRGTPGGPFSAGADISEFTTLRAEPAGARAYSEAVKAGEGALIRFPKPTIALVQGFAIGGGTQVAVACDLRVCDTTSRFGVTPAKLGIVYALESTARLVETVGAAWARWILLTGDLLDAEQALRIGLVHEVHEPDVVEDRAYALAATLSSRARISLTGGKELVSRAVHGRLAEDAEVQALYAQSWTSGEYAEGVEAFLAKRTPDFRGRRSRPPGP